MKNTHYEEFIAFLKATDLVYWELEKPIAGAEIVLGKPAFTKENYKKHGSKKSNGYSDFHAVWEFNSEGKLIRHSVWE